MIPFNNKKNMIKLIKKSGIKHTSIEIINQQSNVFRH